MVELSAWGIDERYRDEFGHWHEVPQETKNKFLSVMRDGHGDEPQKSGIARADVDAIAKKAIALPSLHVIGLMAIPPIGTPEESRPYFRELRSMRVTEREGGGPTEIAGDRCLWRCDACRGGRRRRIR